MTIGQRINRRRIELGLSIDDVAKKLKKNRATVYRYESDSIENLPISILEPLANVLRTTPAYIMGWDNNISNLDNETMKNNINPLLLNKLEEHGLTSDDINNLTETQFNLIVNMILEISKKRS